MKLKLILFFLICNTIIVNASQVDTLMVMSKSMNKSIPNIVIIPNDYSTQNENYSVLYLLHGAGDDYTSWISKVPRIKEYADTYNNPLCIMI